MNSFHLKEGGLLDQYKLLCAVIDAPWSTRLDIKVLRHIVDRYYAKFNNARVSLRYLQQATGATRTNVIESLRRMVGGGVMTVVRQGIGTRPTEYDLNFEFRTKIASGPVGDTATSGPVGDTSSGPVEDTASAPSGPVDGTESYLRNRPTGRLTVSRNNTPAAPSAPSLGGVDATPAESAGDPFEALWAVYPRKQQRAKARSAFKALAPNEELQAKLMESANGWAERYRAGDTPTKWQKHLHTWLTGECYLEDPPEPYENAKDAAIARSRAQTPTKAAARERPANALGLSARTPQGEHEVEVTGSDMPDDPGSDEQRLTFHYRIVGGRHDGKEFSHTWKCVSADEALLESGQAALAELRNGAGIVELNDTSDLHGAKVQAIVRPMGRIEYRPL